MTSGAIRLLPGGDPASGMQPSDLTGPEAFTTGDRTELNHTFFAAPDESLLCGVWECAPSREQIAAYPVDEMMTVISGSVTVTGEDGKAETFAAGDSLFIAKGTKCTWEITETLTKYYLIVA